ncbi:MAG: response regulator [Gammaproteobacteria bacterium]|nr:response regulator [Gammaproteobacteria bacterium]
MNDNKPLIIWVDDDFSLRVVAERVLIKAGFECITAGSGEEAIVLLDQVVPDLILLDLEMPGVSGFKTCSAIRQHTAHKNVPVLTVTCHDDFSSIERAYEMGATDFMIKPLNWKLLVYRIQYMLRSDQIIKNLNQCKSRLRNVQKVAQLGTWEWNAKTGIVHLSQEAQLLLGFIEQSELSYDEFLQCVHPGDRDRFVFSLEHSSSDSSDAAISPFMIEHRLINAQSESLEVIQVGEVSRYRGNKPIWITSAMQEAYRHHQSFAQNVDVYSGVGQRS